jgi:murein DD-endopeptidase MepM/ murein hydrolase activator NlpD
VQTFMHIVVSAVASCSWSSLIPARAVITDPFRAPACERCPGNRGIEFNLSVTDRSRATAVIALRDGEVTFAGAVARTVYVVQRVAPGALITYGRRLRPAVERGDRVSQGDTIGWTLDRLYVGVRVGGRYVDPRVGLAATAPVLVPPGAKSVVCSTVQSGVGTSRPL